MVRKCIEQDRKHIKEYLKQEVEYNTYILADIDDFGFDSEFQTVYVDEENDSIKGVYLCFYQNLIMYSKDNDINTEFLRELFTEYTPDVVMGKLENVNLATELLPDYNIKAQRLYFLNDPANLENDEKEIREYKASELRFKSRRKKEKATVADEELKALEALERREGKSKLEDN